MTKQGSRPAAKTMESGARNYDSDRNGRSARGRARGIDPLVPGIKAGSVCRKSQCTDPESALGTDLQDRSGGWRGDGLFRYE